MYSIVHYVQLYVRNSEVMVLVKMMLSPSTATTTAIATAVAAIVIVQTSIRVPVNTTIGRAIFTSSQDARLHRLEAVQQTRFVESEHPAVPVVAAV